MQDNKAFSSDQTAVWSSCVCVLFFTSWFTDSHTHWHPPINSYYKDISVWVFFLVHFTRDLADFEE